MALIIMFSVIMTSFQTLRLCLYFMRRDKMIVNRVFEMFVLIFMIILCYFLMHSINTLVIILSVILSLLILIKGVYELFYDNSVSILSAKNSVDMCDMGIMFLNNEQEIIFMNNMMSLILKYYRINNNYINELNRISFRKLGNVNLIKYNNKVLQLNINDLEVVLTDVTEQYNLEEENEVKNKIIEENNNRILNTISDIEKIEKTRNLLKIKNEYHDLLGHKLALFSKYLEQNKCNKKDIEFLLNYVYSDSKNVFVKLNDMIKMYGLVGINIVLDGKLPLDEDVSNVLFEIIRESVTNAIIHADSKNININIDNDSNNIKVIIVNDGKLPNKIINENEGIKGMRRKLNSIGGNLIIDTSEGFVLKVII